MEKEEAGGVRFKPSADERYERMEKELGVTFCEDGIFAEMSMELSDYRHTPAPAPEGIRFAFYQGGLERLRTAVAEVDEDWVQYFQTGDRVFCGFDGEKIASFCIVGEDEECLLSDGISKIGSIGCVGTVPAYRKRGIGLSMVALATDYLKRQGCDKAYIHYTHLDRWYAKLGYRTFARFSPKNGRD